MTSRCFRTCRGERASQRAGDCGRVEFKPDSLLAHDRWVPRVAQHLADNVHEAFRGAIGAAEGSSRFLLLSTGSFLRTRRTPLRRSGLPRESSASRFSPPLPSQTITIWQHEVRIQSSLDLDATFAQRVRADVSPLQALQ